MRLDPENTNEYRQHEEQHEDKVQRSSGKGALPCHQNDNEEYQIRYY